MKVVITNTVALNGGDAAILMAVMKLTQLAFGEQIQFSIYDSHPQIARTYYPQLQFRQLVYFQATETIANRYLRKLLKPLNQGRFYVAVWCWQRGLTWLSQGLLSAAELETVRDYATADLIVSTGGTYLVENYAIKPRLFDYWISLLLQKPLIFFTQSLGPFRQRSHRTALQEIFSRSQLVLLRDQLSRQYLKELQIPANKTCVSADAVFAFADPTVLAAASRRPLPQAERLRVAISVRYWTHFKQDSPEVGMDRFRGAIAALCCYLVETHDAEVVFLSTCQGIPEYRYDDSQVGVVIAESLPAPVRQRVRVNRDFHSPEDMLKLLPEFDLTIATRMHMAILSLVAGVPVFPIAYEFKTQELFNRLGLGEWVQSIDQMDESCVPILDQYLRALPQLRPALFEQVRQEHQVAIASAQLVQQAFRTREQSA
uniref:Polysaccharide pyruvyl transferase n=1 Tax=Cyanothece sp. (strain PCC 7425 / ATCC 29141) TaxID=395961 RepID=B8HLM5_CYAP4